VTAEEFAALCVPPTCTLREALAALNSSGRGVLLVLHPDGSLRRTLTDGDLRRAALNHVSDASPVSQLLTSAMPLPNRKPRPGWRCWTGTRSTTCPSSIPPAARPT
jgi:hypothetical protein